MTAQPDGAFFSTGIQQLVEPGREPGIPDVAEGEHLWTMMLTHRIDNPAAWVDTSGDPRDRVLGKHNLLQHFGPFCIMCEEQWSPELEARPCVGDVSEAAHG